MVNVYAYYFSKIDHSINRTTASKIDTLLIDRPIQYIVKQNV